MDLSFLQPYFLGPQAENADLLESLIVEFLRDHNFWRRNFHPEDGTPVTPNAVTTEEYSDFVSRMKTELLKLSAELKRAVPFFSPRYVGHMSSDLLLPGVIARLITTLYNPNNVSEEGAPITLEKELEVGMQLAQMFGMPTDDSQEPCAWGHLTSGGTVANYEALWNFRSVKFYPVALAEAARTSGFDPGPVGPLQKPLADYSKWELMNLSIEATIELRQQCVAVMRGSESRDTLHAFSHAVRAERIETLGTAGFFLKHRDIKPPKLLIATSAHYSWEKGMKVLGLGTANLVQVDVDDNMRLNSQHLETCIAREAADECPILCAVGVLGTTEFGTVDPIHDIVALRNKWRTQGVDFGVHADAAWGGYLASVFRETDGSFRGYDELRSGFQHFPSRDVYESFRALGEVDSITVDPHKLGYIPYSSGAFIARDRRVVDFLAQKAAYVFDLGMSDEELPMSKKLRNLGQYILEGSKPGAAAASVHVTHAVLPLDKTGFGRMLAVTVHSAEYFHASVDRMRAKLADVVDIYVPFETDTNLICLVVNPKGNRDLAVMNSFGRTLFAAMKVDPSQPIQVKEFIGSYTSLLKDTLAEDQATRILEDLDIDPRTFQSLPSDRSREADHLYLLRHTLMNPWLLHEQGGRNHIDRYWAYLEGLIRASLKTND